MIVAVGDFLLNDVAQDFHINDISRIRINFSAHAHFKVVIVSVVVRIVAFPENPFVGFVVPVRIVKPVCGIEMLFSKDSNVHKCEGNG